MTQYYCPLCDWDFSSSKMGFSHTHQAPIFSTSKDKVYGLRYQLPECKTFVLINYEVVLTINSIVILTIERIERLLLLK